jgi:hypothetical protein
MLLVSGATKTVRRLAGPGVPLDVLFDPLSNNGPSLARDMGLRWAADNGAFTGFNEVAFEKMLKRLFGLPGCLFVAAPDVVGDWDATRDLFEEWGPRIRRMGFPVAVVGQDGWEPETFDWDQADACFIGGTDDFKLGREAVAMIREAHSWCKWVHVGRCNRNRRIRKFWDMRADSFDGRSFSAWPDVHIPRALSQLRRLRGEGDLFARIDAGGG